MNKAHDELREVVRRKYAQIATSPRRGSGHSCCGGCEAPPDETTFIGDAYEPVGGYVREADLGLGCGLPVRHAGLRPGQTVLDLGSGAGLDVFVARSEVGEQGRVIGVDMTAEMVRKARYNAERAGFDNVEFRLGEIEHLPVDSASVDVVLSNCVLNLVPDKEQAFREIFRTLRPGGHFCISDIVSSTELPQWLSGVAEAYAGCVAGAIPRVQYLELIRKAGFTGVEVLSERNIDVPEELLRRSLDAEQREELRTRGLHVISVTVKGLKPA